MHLLDTIEKKRDFIKTWAKEYASMRRNPKTYAKLINGDWDLDILNDMMFSFHVVTPIADSHPQKATLAAVGIRYACNCQNFNHYHTCKHAIAFGLFKKEVTVPARFSTETVGKRKAPAGASLSKRSKCLVID